MSYVSTAIGQICAVPCKTGYIKKCLPVSGTVFTKLSNTSVVIGLPKQTSAIVFRDRDIFAHSSIVSSRNPLRDWPYCGAG